MRRSVVRSVETDHRTNMESPKLPSRSKPLYFALFPRFFLSNPKHAKKNLWIFVAAAAATIPLFLFLFFAATNSRSRGDKRFGIVIDGRSTGTRIHVFEFLNASGNVILDLKNGGLASMKVNPGLSSFSDDPEGAGMSLSELLEFGKGRIPKDYWGETDIRLMATAGLRRLDVEVQERILEACRRVLRSSGFRFKDEWASVISGADEGIYAWAAANYALGTLGGDPQETTGIIELGGASAQVTFASSESLPSEFSHTIKFGEFTYNLYSHSLLDFGLNVAYDSLHESLLSRDLKLSGRSIGERICVDPCTPRGFSLGAKSVKFPASVLGAKDQLFSSIRARGNFSECRSAALMLLQKGKDECSHQQCLIGSTFIPELQGKFLATENFFYTSKFFGLPTTAFLSDLILAGQKFCGEDWRMLKKKYNTLHEEDLVTYCFSSAYIVALLHDSLGISLNDERIGFANQAGSARLGTGCIYIAENRGN